MTLQSALGAGKRDGSQNEGTTREKKREKPDPKTKKRKPQTESVFTV